MEGDGVLRNDSPPDPCWWFPSLEAIPIVTVKCEEITLRYQTRKLTRMKYTFYVSTTRKMLPHPDHLF